MRFVQHHQTAALLLLALLLSACGTSGLPTTAAVGPTAAGKAQTLDDQLLVRQTAETTDQVSLLTSPSSAALSLPLGAADQGWHTLYSLKRGEFKGQTSIYAIDPRTGVTLRTTTIEGDYQLAAVGLDGMPGGLSPDGSKLVVVAYPQPGAGQEQDSFAVLNTDFQTPAQLVKLNGLFSFDAISNDGSSLYLTEHLEKDHSKYQVRRYDMATKLLDEQVIVDKTNQSVMRGVRHVALASRNGEWLFTLYLNDAQGPFIHALNLDNRYAMCVPLLPDGKDNHEQQLRYTLALSPDGSHVYAANGAFGVVSVLPTWMPYEVQHHRLNDPSGEALAAAFHQHDSNLATTIASDTDIPSGYAAISPDNKTLYTLGETGILAIDIPTMKPIKNYLADQPIDSIGLSSDGLRLYGGSSKRGTVTQLDLTSGAAVHTFSQQPGFDSLLWVNSTS